MSSALGTTSSRQQQQDQMCHTLNACEQRMKRSKRAKLRFAMIVPCALLIGLVFALAHDQFSKEPSWTTIITNNSTRHLVSSGGRQLATPSASTTAGTNRSSEGNFFGSVLGSLFKFFQSLIKLRPPSPSPSPVAKPPSPTTGMPPTAPSKPTAPSPTSMPPPVAKPSAPSPTAVPPPVAKPTAPSPIAVPPPVAKPTAPSPTAVPPPSPTPGGCKKYPSPPPLPGKKGAALTLRDEGKPGSWIDNFPKVLLLKPFWNYSWGPKRVDAQPKDIEFVPMLWGGNNATSLQQSLNDYIIPQVASGNATHLLGFNEPDQKTQSNMLVEVALDRWRILESANLPLVSPGCAQPAGEWMKNFMGNATKTCKRVDWVSVHWYGGASFENFIARMTEYHELYGRPILITEFAPADYSATTVESNRLKPSAVLAFMKQALPWLEAQDWVAGYAWFSFGITSPVGTSSALFDEQGELTACGRFYASVRTDRPKGDQSIAPDP